MVLALVGFVVLGIALKSLCPVAVLETYDPREKTLLADLVKGWNACNQAPEVCFLGSSLMQCALQDADPFVVSRASEGKFSGPFFSWALGGENVSDAYMIASTMISSSKKPRLLIYGIAPRDFLDNNVVSPASTDIFRYLSSCYDVFSIPSIAFTTPEDRLAFSLKRASFLVDRKDAFSKCAASELQTLLPMALPVMRNVKSGTQDQQKLEAAQAKINAVDKANPKAQTVDQKRAMEYLLAVSKGVTIFRYNPYSPERYNRQVAFFDKLLGHLQSTGVSVLLIKMPLKDEHVAIMPKELINSYAKDVDRLATKYGASVVDFNSSAYSDANFGDVAHLNKSGARIFQDMLVKTFREHKVAFRSHENIAR